jgi:hypothetical protein
MVSIPEPVSVMSSRSIPIPLPPLGGIPYSIVVAEVFVQRHRLLITGSDECDLRMETFSLHHRINRLESSWSTQRIDPILDRTAALRCCQVSAEVSTGKFFTKPNLLIGHHAGLKQRFDQLSD